MKLPYKEYKSLLDAAHEEAEANRKHEVELPFAQVDWRERPDEVLEEVQKQLSSHGLQIVFYDTKSDCFAWKIEEIVE